MLLVEILSLHSNNLRCFTNMDDDLYDDDADEQTLERNLLHNAHSKLYNDGYREKKLAMEEKYMQEGFDDGIKMSLSSGKSLGGIYSRYRVLLKSSFKGENNDELTDVFSSLLTKLDTLFMVTVPELMIKISAESIEPDCNELVGCMLRMSCATKELLFNYNKLLEENKIVVPERLKEEILCLNLTAE